MLGGSGKSSVFSLSGAFTYAGTGNDLYQSFSTSATWQPGVIFSVQVSVPYVWNSGEDKLTFMEYEANGIGDMRITAWADMTEWLFMPRTLQSEKKSPDEGPPAGFLPDPFAGLAQPPAEPEEQKGSEVNKDTRAHFRFGLGLRLSTGDHKVRDSADVLLPTRFQPGWGVTSLVTGIGYRQNFGNVRTNATLMYEPSGGENSVDYKHGDIIRFDTGAYYPLYEKYSLVGGLGYSLTWISTEDRSAGIKVKDTDGTFHSINLICGVAVCRGLSVALRIRMPVNSTSSVSGNNVDFQYGLSLTYYF
jgi:hypothetical protein